jgi:hypothetical protein
MKTGSAAIVAVEVFAAELAADPPRPAVQDRRGEALRQRPEPRARRVSDDPRPLLGGERGELLGEAAEEGSSRERWGVFAPMLETTASVYPTPIEKVDEALLAQWGRLADAQRDPIVAARLNDLLWARRWGSRPDRRARTALAAIRGGNSIGPPRLPASGSGDGVTASRACPRVLWSKLPCGPRCRAPGDAASERYGTFAISWWCAFTPIWPRDSPWLLPSL